MISVLNLTNIFDSDISLYLNYALESYEHKIVDKFEGMDKGIVFIQISENAYDYPYLVDKNDCEILYVYLTGYQCMNIFGPENYIIGMSNNPPEYNVKIDQFRDRLDCLNKLKELKNVCDKLDRVGEKSDELYLALNQLLHNISKLDDVRKEYDRLLSNF